MDVRPFPGGARFPKKGRRLSSSPFFRAGSRGPRTRTRLAPRTRPGPKRKRFPPCRGWKNGWCGGCEQGGTGGSGRNAEIAPRPPAKPPGTMGSREGSPPPDTLPRGRMRGAGKAGRGRGAGVSRRGPAPSLTILPNQSGEIRLTANLLDTRRRFAPPTKGAGSGRNGGYRGKGWREAERVRLSGEIRLAANLWIRGDASRRQRKMAGSGTGADECARKTPAKRGLFLR